MSICKTQCVCSKIVCLLPGKRVLWIFVIIESNHSTFDFFLTSSTLSYSPCYFLDNEGQETSPNDFWSIAHHSSHFCAASSSSLDYGLCRSPSHCNILGCVRSFFDDQDVLVVQVMVLVNILIRIQNETTMIWDCSWGLFIPINSWSLSSLSLSGFRLSFKSPAVCTTCQLPARQWSKTHLFLKHTRIGNVRAFAITLLRTLSSEDKSYSDQHLPPTICKQNKHTHHVEKLLNCISSFVDV